MSLLPWMDDFKPLSVSKSKSVRCRCLATRGENNSFVKRSGLIFCWGSNTMDWLRVPLALESGLRLQADLLLKLVDSMHGRLPDFEVPEMKK